MNVFLSFVFSAKPKSAPSMLVSFNCLICFFLKEKGIVGSVGDFYFIYFIFLHAFLSKCM